MFDVIVVGLGAMGSSVAAHAAAKGLRVLALEQFHPVHAYGASHGRTRLIRQAYFEGSSYVPLLLRAYRLWDELEAQTAMSLRSRTGALYIGSAESALISGTLSSARKYGLAVEELDYEALQRRFPVLAALPTDVGVVERDAGVIFPEAAVRAHIQIAVAKGAQLRFGVRVERWQALRGSRIRVVTQAGDTVEAASLVLCPGPWYESVTRATDIPIKVERNVQFWFRPSDSQAFGPQHFQAFAIDRPGSKFFYGFPDYGDGVKCAFHHSGRYTTPDDLERDISDGEIVQAHNSLGAVFPKAAGEFAGAMACMYALTPDEHFVIGAHPGYHNVILAGGFSGHGFKFSPVVGEIVADLLVGADPGPIDMFSPKRFGPKP